MKRIINCCPSMQTNIELRNIESGSSATIFGRPSFCNDGDGHFDDMTGNIEIDFCPWCGKKIELQQ